jgi:hypothetical protein
MDGTVFPRSAKEATRGYGILKKYCPRIAASRVTLIITVFVKLGMILSVVHLRK